MESCTRFLLRTRRAGFARSAPDQSLDRRVQRFDRSDAANAYRGVVLPNLGSSNKKSRFSFTTVPFRARWRSNICSTAANIWSGVSWARFSEQRDLGPQLVHGASDGETNGHHHRFGDMALAYALNQIEGQDMAHMTNYGEFLEKFPPRFEAEIIDDTSWSCMHGIERWRSDCGCNTGGLPGWNQAWRKPLRDSFDWLRERLISIFEQHGGELLRNPWAARDEYIDLIFDRSQEDVDEFMERHANARARATTEKQRALKLLEMQRQAMFMYTSCGWFFNDVSGLETVQVIQYAARALQLAEQVSGQKLEPEFLALLELACRATSADLGNGCEKFMSGT